MTYRRADTPYTASPRSQAGPYYNPGYAQPPLYPRSWNGTPRTGWNRQVPRYRRYSSPQVFTRPILSYPTASPVHRNRRQGGTWTDWRQNPHLQPPPTPKLLPASLHYHSPDRYSVPASPRGIPRVVPGVSQENVFSEIMNGAFDLEKSPTSLGQKLANIDIKPPSDWLLQQSNPFGTQNQQQRKRAASSQITPPAETYKKANSSSSDRSNRTEPALAELSYKTDTLGPGEPGLSTLVHLIQQNTKQSAELKNLLLAYLHQKEGGTNSHQVSISGSDTARQSTDENDRMLSPGPHVANGGGESPDPPHGSKGIFRGHMIDCVGVESASDSRSNSEEERSSTKATSVEAVSFDNEGSPKDPQEKSPSNTINTHHHLSSFQDPVLSRDFDERLNRFERPPRREHIVSTEADNRRTLWRQKSLNLCGRAPSPGGSPSGKQVEFDLVLKSPAPGSPHSSSTDSERHVRTLPNPPDRHSSRSSSEISSPESPSLLRSQVVNRCVPSEFVLPYQNPARDRSCESWGSSPRSP
ncbi:hypothetical protein MGYG_06741 [Nannizzia gypsea CBS 118893]|uniref:Uncharacterized protein n=1 Tax=Arthroderma gypseum (strain ATCC MYA-4604 / CBS 118893) TaxID=535722 RepID=E4V127_ARTGP|nr:hypothetical protein MGYG_06741 [Nannizzia gypsea CBS 118893]EFR03742.1 hypothetical protein MGYG_06741 [Nannizzia gypsea CBS 118893]